MDFREWILCEMAIEIDLNEVLNSLYTHRTTPEFNAIWKGKDIPEKVKLLAQGAFTRMLIDPATVDLKHMVSSFASNVYRAKIGDRWRALAVKKGNTLYWFWIGPRETINNYRGSALQSPNIGNIKPRSKPEKKQEPLEIR